MNVNDMFITARSTSHLISSGWEKRDGKIRLIHADIFLADLEALEETKIGSSIINVINQNNDSGEGIIDDYTQSIYEASSAIETVREQLFEDCDFLSDPVYVLERFEIIPKYRGMGLGHIALHTALQAAGCELSSVFINVSQSDKDSGLEFLTRLYSEMDIDTRHLSIDTPHLQYKEMHFIWIQSYN